MWCYKVPYGVPNMNCVDFSENICSPVLVLFADSKLLDFARARFMCGVLYTVCNPRHMRFRHTCKNGHRYHAFLTQSTGKLSTIVG